MTFTYLVTYNEYENKINDYLIFSMFTTDFIDIFGKLLKML